MSQLESREVLEYDEKNNTFKNDNFDEITRKEIVSYEYLYYNIEYKKVSDYVKFTKAERSLNDTNNVWYQLNMRYNKITDNKAIITNGRLDTIIITYLINYLWSYVLIQMDKQCNILIFI